jgi:Fur family ferric uptake transcriptional regulator
MVITAEESWAEHALATLQGAGLRRGGARTAVIEALAHHDCAISALELDDELRRRKPRVGRASIYRALEQLEELGLVRRIEATRGTASYERTEPDGHHHHHVICDSCGKMETFEDADLERVIGRVSRRVEFKVDEHDVVLRGRCPSCSG